MSLSIKHKKSFAITIIVSLIVLIGVSVPMIRALLLGNYVEGKVIAEQTTIKHNPSSPGKSVATGTSGPTQSYLHEIVVEYQVKDQVFTRRINMHVFKYFNLFKYGDSVTVFFSANKPQNGDVLDYGLYGPLTLISAYIFLAVLIGIAIQIVWARLRAKP